MSKENQKPEHVHWQSLFDKKYLGSWDLPTDGTDLIVTITHITKEDVTNEKGTKTCVIAHIHGHKSMIINIGNGWALQSVTGTSNVNEWRNIRIALTSEKRRNPRNIGPKMVDGLKIRTKPPVKEKLTPTHKKWNACKKAVKSGAYTLGQLKSIYSITPENEIALCAKDQ